MSRFVYNNSPYFGNAILVHTKSDANTTRDNVDVLTAWVSYRSQNRVIELQSTAIGLQQAIASAQIESTNLQRAVGEQTKELIKHIKRLAIYTKWLAIGTFI